MTDYEVTNIHTDDQDFALADSKLRADLELAQAELDALRKKAEDYVANRPSEPGEPDAGFKDEASAIAGINSAFGTDGIWDALAKAGDFVRANPSAFEHFVGRETTYNHSEYGEQTVRIVDVAYYDKSDGSGKAAFVLDHKKSLLKDKMNPSNITLAGGYTSASLKDTVNVDVYSGMPDIVRKHIPTVDVPYNYKVTANQPVSTTELNLFVPSATEIFGNHIYEQTGGEPFASRFRLYSVNDTDQFRIKKYEETDLIWWTRTQVSTSKFASVGASGNNTESAITGSYGVSPIFCIG